MKLINNFVELSNYSNLEEISSKWFNFKKLNDFEFDKRIKLPDGLYDIELLKLDHFITSILKYYPFLYTNIVLSSKNYSRTILTNNKKLDELILKNIDEKNVSIATNLFTSKSPTKFINNELPKNIKDKELSHIYKSINNLLAKEFTIYELFKEVHTLIVKEFTTIIPFEQTLRYLAQFITAEIYLRTKVPEEYVFIDEYNMMEESFENFNYSHYSEILKAIKKSLREGKTSQAILEDLQDFYVI